MMVDGWRLIDPEGEPPAPPTAPPTTESSIKPLMLVIGAAILSVVGVAIWMTLPAGGVQLDVAGQAGPGSIESLGVGQSSVALTAAPSEIVVDVQGAVALPGIHRLPSGSRVADAISAAGGYSAQIDIVAAAERLNLAQPLVDGTKIHVPLRGEVAATAPSAEPQNGQPGGGLIDVNHASSSELDTLPGVGPVTAQKIIDARAQAPFASVDELLSRGVLGQATFDKLRDLVTVNP